MSVNNEEALPAETAKPEDVEPPVQGGGSNSSSSVDPEQLRRDARELAAWQRKLLPFMTIFLVIMSIVFFSITLMSVYEMRSFIYERQHDNGPVRPQIEKIANSKTPGAVIDSVQQGLLVLEADALDKRYAQASALLLSRVWTRQLAFLTGMILAFIGAVFIIGKLSVTETTVNAEHADWKAGIKSSSPGLILAFMGTTLMAIALIVQPPIDVNDRPIYFQLLGINAKVSSAGVDGQQNKDKKQQPSGRNPDDDPFHSQKQ